MVQPRGDGIRSQDDNKKIHNRDLCCLPDRVGRAAKRIPLLLQGAMNQAAEFLPPPLGEAGHCQLQTALFQRRRAQLN